MQVRIPAGRQRRPADPAEGQGRPGERGGPAGDLYVVVHVAPHPVFGRKGDNLTVTVPVTFAEAALGAEIKVPTLGGPPVTLQAARRAPPNGRTFRVARQGRDRARTAPRGDLLVTVEVAVPARSSTARPREALEAFRDATAGEDPRAGLFDAARREPEMMARRSRRRLGRPTTPPVYVISVAAAADRPAPADPAPVRPARPGLPGPHAGRRPALLRARHRAAARGASGCPGRASTSPASSASSSWRTRSPRCSARVGRAARPSWRLPAARPRTPRPTVRYRTRRLAPADARRRDRPDAPT